VSVGTRPLIVIRRDDLGLVWHIHPEDRIYFETKTAKLDAASGKLFSPIELKWREARRKRIGGILCRHFIGVGQTRHGRGEEHVFVDPTTGMFRREVTSLRGMRTRVDWSDVELTRPPDHLFEFDKKGYKRGRV
jgi:hypothetical protein